VSAGTDAVLKLGVSCSQGCDLQGKTVRVVSRDGGMLVEAPLSRKGESNETGELRVKAPTKLGEFILNITFPAQVVGDIPHGESSFQLNLAVRQHATSMAVWGFPSPVIARSKFKVNVGVSCSVNCELTGRRVQVCDEKGRKVGSGKLRKDPWPQTTGLYWADVGLSAPPTAGVRTWNAVFEKPRMKLPHEGTGSSFSFRVAKPPQYTVIVEVMDKATKAPIKSATVLLFPYEGTTDDNGVARVKVAGGKYKVEVGADRFIPFQTSVEVRGDTTQKIELMAAPVFY